MANGNKSDDGGLLGTGRSRPPFFRRIVDIYKSDVPFRGLVDFALIGTLVLLFLHPPTSATWPSLWGGSQSGKGQPETQMPAPPQGGLVQPPAGGGQVGRAAAVPIPFPAEVVRPGTSGPMIAEIDEAAFRSSRPEDLPKLIAATRAFRSRQRIEILTILKDANGSDPNVAFMRGLANVGDADSNKASVEHFKAAADGGHRLASIVYGRMLIWAPPGVTKNVELGRQLIEKAVAAGDRQAQRVAAIAYMSGEFGALDPTKARDLFSKAAQAGDPQAMLHYANMLYNGIAGPTDQMAAVDFLRRAAAVGLTVAQTAYGSWLVLRFRAGSLSDPSEAAQWLERAYKTGHDLDALNELAAFYGNTPTPPWRDEKKVFELSQLCSGLSSPHCQHNIALAYSNGWGTKPNPDRAWAHFLIAGRLGYRPAIEITQKIEKQLPAAETARVEALSRAIQAGLKPIPPLWYLQYSGVDPPLSPWVAATYPGISPSGAIGPKVGSPGTTTSPGPASPGPKAGPPAPTGSPSPKAGPPGPTRPSAPTPGSPSATGPKVGPPAPTGPPSPKAPVPSASVPVGTPIDFGSDHTRASGFFGHWMSIDASAFRSSPAPLQARLSEALRAYREGRLGDILNILNGAPDGDANVAFMRATGLYDSARDNPQMERLLRSAAAAGQADAAALLGLVLIFPHVEITTNVAEGRKLLERGAGRKERFAMFALGLALASDKLGAPNPAAAVGYFKAGADAGDPAASLFLAAFFQGGVGVSQDMGAAETYLRQAAKLGLTNAQLVLGTWQLARFAKKEIGGPVEGLQWLDRAYRLGKSSVALDRTIVFYADSPKGSPWRNRQKALELAKICIAFNWVTCHGYYARLLSTGDGIPIDNLRAYAHFDVARSLGNNAVVKFMEQLENRLTASELAQARKLSPTILQQLKPLPAAATFQAPSAN